MAWRWLSALALACAATAAPACAPATETPRPFAAWLEDDLWPEARERGIGRAVFDAAFAGLALEHDAEADAASAQQPEFRAPGAYFAPRHLEELAELGRARLRRWRSTLAAVERRSGVPPHVVVAVWGRESSFGRTPLRHDAIEVLARRAWLGPRRAVFRAELLAALELLAEGRHRREQLRSSSAGALGQPQFLPSVFRSHAVDFDGDGRADIWRSVPDTLASIAHYLDRHGWQAGRDWGYEVTLPASVPCTLEGADHARPIAAWRELGVARTRSRRFSADALEHDAFLVLPAGRLGPAYLATPNFAVLKAYNRSDLYALYVGLLADRMLGERPPTGRWRPVADLDRGEVRALQRELVSAGYDVGGVDGLIGVRTRVALGNAQRREGRDATCFPTAS